MNTISKVFLTFIISTFSYISIAQQINIEKYCSDMSIALETDANWRRRCVSKLEVDIKYQKEIQQNFERKRKAKEANIALDNNINWTVAVDSLAQEINRTTNIDKKNALLIKFETKFAECSLYSSQSECDEVRKDLGIPSPK